MNPLHLQLMVHCPLIPPNFRKRRRRTRGNCTAQAAITRGAHIMHDQRRPLNHTVTRRLEHSLRTAPMTLISVLPTLLSTGQCHESRCDNCTGDSLADILTVGSECDPYDRQLREIDMLISRGSHDTSREDPSSARCDYSLYVCNPQNLFFSVRLHYRTQEEKRNSAGPRLEEIRITRHTHPIETKRSHKTAKFKRGDK